MKRIYIPTQSPSDWQSLLAQPTLHWKAGFSAMATAACWEDCNPDLPPEITATLTASGIPDLLDLELLAAMPERVTALPGGGAPSHTDVLALTRSKRGLVVLSVEAKVDESFGPTVGAKRKNATQGQLKRIAYMECVLGLSEPLADSIRYQLVHRAVAAVLNARTFHARAGVMLVHSFSPTGKSRADFDAFVEAVSAQQRTSDLYELTVPDGPRIFAGWCQGPCKYLEVDLSGAR